MTTQIMVHAGVILKKKTHSSHYKFYFDFMPEVVFLGYKDYFDEETQKELAVVGEKSFVSISYIIYKIKKGNKDQKIYTIESFFVHNLVEEKKGSFKRSISNKLKK
jgi:hypothetical protein